MKICRSPSLAPPSSPSWPSGPSGPSASASSSSSWDGQFTPSDHVIAVQNTAFIKQPDIFTGNICEQLWTWGSKWFASGIRGKPFSKPQVIGWKFKRVTETRFTNILTQADSLVDPFGHKIPRVSGSFFILSAPVASALPMFERRDADQTYPKNRKPAASGDRTSDPSDPSDPSSSDGCWLTPKASKSFEKPGLGNNKRLKWLQTSWHPCWYTNHTQTYPSFKYDLLIWTHFLSTFPNFPAVFSMGFIPFLHPKWEANLALRAAALRRRS